MPKIPCLGAGSSVSARDLLGDILSFPELAEVTISLHDTDQLWALVDDLVEAHGDWLPACYAAANESQESVHG